jgi:hypothetical protein
LGFGRAASEFDLRDRHEAAELMRVGVESLGLHLDRTARTQRHADVIEPG